MIRDPCIYYNPKPSMYEGNQLGQPVPPAKRQRKGRSLMIPQTFLVKKSQGGMKDRELVFRLTGGQFGCTCTSVSNGRCAGGHHCDAPFWEERFLKSDKKHGSMAQCIGTLWQSWRFGESRMKRRAARPCVFNLWRAPLVQRVSNWRERRVRANMGPKKVVEALYIYTYI